MPPIAIMAGPIIAAITSRAGRAMVKARITATSPPITNMRRASQTNWEMLDLCSARANRAVMPATGPAEATGDHWMAKEELLEFDGTVTEVLPDGNFRVKLDNEHEVLAYTAGKMRK